jgi:ketosteroid isomerase-like protein
VARETESLLQTDRAWAQVSAAGGNPDSVLAFWTDDARVAMPGAPVFAGKAALRQMVTNSFSMPGFHISWTPERAVVAASGDLGYTTGTNTVSMPDSTGKATPMVGRYLTVWRRDSSGRWRCAEDYSSPGPIEPPTQRP